MGRRRVWGLACALGLGAGLLWLSQDGSRGGEARRAERRDGTAAVQAGTQSPSPRLHFEANRGQYDPAARYVARGPGYALWLTPDAAVVSLRGEGGASGGSI